MNDKNPIPVAAEKENKTADMRPVGRCVITYLGGLEASRWLSDGTSGNGESADLWALICQ